MKVKEESEKAGWKLNIQKKLRPWYPVPWPHGKHKVKKWKQWQILFSWDPKSLQTMTAALKLKKTLAPWKESSDKPRQRVKKPRHHFADKGPYSQSYDFSSSHEWMWELNHKEDWAPKNWLYNCGSGRDLRIPWTARRSKSSVLKEINPEYSLEGLMLKLKLQ